MTGFLSSRTMIQLSSFHEHLSGYGPVRVVNPRHVLRSRPLRWSSLLHGVPVSLQRNPPRTTAGLANTQTPIHRHLHILTHAHTHTHTHTTLHWHTQAFVEHMRQLSVHPLTRAAIRPGPRQRKTQMSVRMEKGYREARSSMLLICSLGLNWVDQQRDQAPETCEIYPNYQLLRQWPHIYDEEVGQRATSWHVSDWRGRSELQPFFCLPITQCIPVSGSSLIKINHKALQL